MVSNGQAFPQGPFAAFARLKCSVQGLTRRVVAIFINAGRFTIRFLTGGGVAKSSQLARSVRQKEDSGPEPISSFCGSIQSPLPVVSTFEF